jgi:hypothetical protein
VYVFKQIVISLVSEFIASPERKPYLFCSGILLPGAKFFLSSLSDLSRLTFTECFKSGMVKQPSKESTVNLAKNAQILICGSLLRLISCG